MNIYKKLFHELHNSNYKETSSFKRFFLRSKKNIIIIFFIQSSKNTTLEDICLNIYPKVISRSTIQNILNEGVSIGFFEKKINIKDKRGKIYTLSSNAKDILDEWINNQKKIYSNVGDNFQLAC